MWIGAESGSQRILDAMGRRTDAAAHARGQIGLLQEPRHRGRDVHHARLRGRRPTTDLAATVDHLKAAAPDPFLTTVAYPIKGTDYYRQVADRVISPTSWDEGSDRDLTVAGRRSRLFYRFAIRWLVNEVAFSRQKGYGLRSQGRRLATFLNAALGRLGMLLTRHQVESARAHPQAHPTALAESIAAPPPARPPS